MKKMIDCCSLFPFLAGLFLITGCTSDEEKLPSNRIEGNEVTFSFSLSGNNLSTRALDSSQESEIKTLDVLVFKEVTPGQEVFDYRFSVNPSDISTSNPRQFTSKVKLLSERQKFVLLTNVGDEVNLLSAAGQTKEDVLNALIVSNSGKWNVNNNFRALPMWGETDLVTLNSTSSVLPSHITLYRMQAKIDLRLSSTAQSKFSLKEVYLYKYNSFGRLVPDASNWSSGTATAPTLPLNPQTVAVPTWKYNSSDGVETTKAQNTIYLFETKAKNTSDPTDEFAIVVGGNYQGNSSLSYYRIDIKNTAKTQYVDILRNHHYTITISDVTSAGSNTPGDAYEGGGIAMSASVTAWNLAAQNTTIDPPHTLQLDSTVALLDWQGSLLRFGVNSTETNGWAIADNQLTKGVTVSNQTSTSIDFENIFFKNYSTTTELSCGYIDLQAGNLKYKLEVRMGCKPATPWAGSNIYWNGSKLTFDDTGDTSHAVCQGVFFKWGSLWGIVPVDGTTKMVYTPTGVQTVAWADIPYMTTGSDNDRDALYLYDNHDPVNHVGDICRYLTEQAGGTLHGKKWRMPSSNEFEVESDYLSSGNFDSQSGTSSDGTTSILSGYKRDNTYFPASGYDNGSSTMGHVGESGYYWSSSSFDSSRAYSLVFGSNTDIRNDIRSYGFTVRCVQE